MKIFLVRHGQSTGNADRSEYLKTHNSEIELTEKGKEDAANSANTINSIISKQWDIEYSEFLSRERPKKMYVTLVSSTYKRADQTASIMHDKFRPNTSPCSIQKRLYSPLCIERWGWEALRSKIEDGANRKDLFNFYYKPENGESYCDVYLRAVVFHQWLLSNSTYDTHVIVAHGEFNKVYLMYLLNWNVEEFDKWDTQNNGEVLLINNGRLSPLTPLRPNPYK